MHSILARYLAINPQQINTFNLPHHDFVPSEDPAADARFLQDVQDGTTQRFYVTFSEQVNRFRFDILVVDKFNQNVAASFQVEQRRTPYGSMHDYVDACWRCAAQLAAELDAEFRPEPEDCALHSFQAHALLRAAGLRNQAIAVADWPVASASTPTAHTGPLPAVARVCAVLAIVFVLMCGSVATTHAQMVRPKVPICRLIHGVRVCLPVHGGSGITIVPHNGGSGITPPVFQQRSR